MSHPLHLQAKCHRLCISYKGNPKMRGLPLAFHGANLHFGNT
jgi:hypothetical protein